MAYGILAKPGSKLGPCAEPCQHVDCAASREQAAALCRLCDRPIGYETRFQMLPSGSKSLRLVHTACEEADNG